MKEITLETFTRNLNDIYHWHDCGVGTYTGKMKVNSLMEKVNTDNAYLQAVTQVILMDEDINAQLIIPTPQPSPSNNMQNCFNNPQKSRVFILPDNSKVS